MTQQEFLQIIAQNYPGIIRALPFYCACPPESLMTPPAPNPPSPPAAIPSYGYLTAIGTMSTATGGINFAAQNVSGDISIAEDSIILQHPGAYDVTYTINLPAGAALNTVLNLQLNGQVIPGSQVRVNKTNRAAPNTVYGHAVITVNTVPAALRLLSSTAIDLAADNGTDVLASLKIVRI